MTHKPGTTEFGRKRKDGFEGANSGSCRYRTRFEKEAVVIHHVSVGTNDVGRSKRFYDAVLPIVGIVPMAEDEGGLGYGSGTFHFSVQVPIDGRPATVGNGTHIAFAVEDRSMVDRFYAAALEHGGRDDGPLGLRPDYDANYYGAFVRDPDGHKIEAVTYSAK
ncbi:VOC family protein [Bradyrhizobium sp. CCBAU 051011]|uniref:VOC family protein n=1 Tax=Bradyrhizobium sp. CCBAU 051011 TaxID=858422 RepID=UPI001FEE0E55|nr:VOC family protein [Bradyrhizobium sp. CCBAU 051011]